MQRRPEDTRIPIIRTDITPLKLFILRPRRSTRPLLRRGNTKDFMLPRVAGWVRLVTPMTCIVQPVSRRTVESREVVPGAIDAVVIRGLDWVPECAAVGVVVDQADFSVQVRDAVGVSSTSSQHGFLILLVRSLKGCETYPLIA